MVDAVASEAPSDGEGTSPLEGSGMDSDDDEESVVDGGDDDEATLEKMLLQDMGEDEDEDADGPSADDDGNKLDMDDFADADDYARMLDDAGKVSKDETFEDRRSVHYGQYAKRGKRGRSGGADNGSRSKRIRKR
jgi:hypothetical protein